MSANEHAFSVQYPHELSKRIGTVQAITDERHAHEYLSVRRRCSCGWPLAVASERGAQEEWNRHVSVEILKVVWALEPLA